MGDQAFRRFGHPDRFAIDLRLLPDPDGDAAAPRESVGSWGRWRLWIRGLNLAEHRLETASGEVLRQEWVTWYVAPLIRWLADVWTPLLHEQRLPAAVRRPDARSAYLSVATTRMDDEKVFAPWQAWAARHSIRSAAEGGLYPDVFLRRVGDDIEASWGDRTQPGGEAVEYVIEPGVAHADVADAAGALDDLLIAMVREDTLRDRPWHKTFRQRVAERPGSGLMQSALPWYLDGQPQDGPLTIASVVMLHDLGKKSPSFQAHRVGNSDQAGHAITRLSPAIAMLGTLSPTTSETAAAQLSTILKSSYTPEHVDTRMDEYIAQDRPAWQASDAWDDGYSLALELLERLNLFDRSDPIDLEQLCGEWKVRCQDEPLGDEGPLGVALAGAGYAPTIIVNADHPHNRHRHGRRFTLAHELCHLLYDRDRARSIGHSSTPWASARVEQRANAFAAMLLMPPAAIRAHGPKSQHPSLAEVARMASDLQVGLSAAIRHLGNMQAISAEASERLLSEAEERQAAFA